MKKITILFFLIICCTMAQQETFSTQDSLRGSITQERIWWDLNYYHLSVDVNSENKCLTGTNLIEFTVLKSSDLLQLDLQPPLKITKVNFQNSQLDFERVGNVYYIKFPTYLSVNSKYKINVHYAGIPIESKRPPWSGGLTWSKDENGNDFIATTCQGDGASIWWPCKDHMYDEPDSMRISITYPNNLLGVANGRLEKINKNNDGTNTSNWFVCTFVSKRDSIN